MEQSFGPLPAGRHGLSREEVALNQRERLIGGLAEVVAKRGYNAVTIADVTKAARVSRRVFYENFESKEDCFLAAFNVVVQYLRELIIEAASECEDWQHEVIEAFRATLRFFADEPDLASLCLVESMTAGPVVAARFQETVASFVPLLEGGREVRKSERLLPESTEVSLIGAMVSLAARTIMAGETRSLPALLPDFVEFGLTPFVGPEEAQRLAAEAGKG